MLEQWEVERMLAWKRRAPKTESMMRLLGSPEFTRKAAGAKLAEARHYRPTCVSRKRLPAQNGELF
mgnify:FL=1